MGYMHDSLEDKIKRDFKSPLNADHEEYKSISSVVHMTLNQFSPHKETNEMNERKSTMGLRRIKGLFEQEEYLENLNLNIASKEKEFNENFSECGIKQIASREIIKEQSNNNMSKKFSATENIKSDNNLTVGASGVIPTFSMIAQNEHIDIDGRSIELTESNNTIFRNRTNEKIVCEDSSGQNDQANDFYKDNLRDLYTKRDNLIEKTTKIRAEIEGFSNIQRYLKKQGGYVVYKSDNEDITIALTNGKGDFDAHHGHSIMKETTTMGTFGNTVEFIPFGDQYDHNLDYIKKNQMRSGAVKSTSQIINNDLLDDAILQYQDDEIMQALHDSDQLDDKVANGIENKLNQENMKLI